MGLRSLCHGVGRGNGQLLRWVGTCPRKTASEFATVSNAQETVKIAHMGEAAPYHVR